MLLRPEQAHWFETYVPRPKTVAALEALAATRLVQLESDTRLAQPLDLTQIRSTLTEFHLLKRHHQELFTDIPHLFLPMQGAPEQMALEAMNFLKDCCDSADRLIVQQLKLESERQNLLLLQECLTALHGSVSDLSRLSHPSKFLYKGVFACRHNHKLSSEICAAVDVFIPGRDHDFFLVADLPGNQSIIEQTCQSEACLHINLPSWLSTQADEQILQVDTRLEKIETGIKTAAEGLERLRQKPELAQAYETMKLLSWYADNANALSGNWVYCHVTGWTTAETAEVLQQALMQVGIQTEIRFPQPPESYKPPVSMILPAWAQPFLLFIEMSGAPGRDEVDPGYLLPFMVSILFGYMFPDIGHGLLLILFSLFLYQRWPEGRFLIPCGLSAVFFGFIFGEFFGLEGPLDPLWVKPLESPLMILIPPLFFGAFLMLLGLIFNGIAAMWRGNFNAWLSHDAAVLVMYGAGCLGIFHSPILWIAAFALLWFILGQFLLPSKASLGVMFSNLGRLIQSLLELLLNTLSFLRVGAFALAHAALSSSVLQIADLFTHPVAHGTALILGHLLIVVIEGLVVFVQTTRLVLFEFFTRFLRSEGRIFRPLNVPPNHSDNRHN